VGRRLSNTGTTDTQRIAILPDGDEEKQLMQGLLNQGEKLEPESGVLF
jgi:hypothetical protein